MSILGKRGRSHKMTWRQKCNATAQPSYLQGHTVKCVKRRSCQSSLGCLQTLCWSWLKWVSLILNENKPDKTTTFNLGYGKTRNISSGPTRFLRQTQSYSSFTTVREAGKHFSDEFERQLNNLDSSLIRSEYKLWIYKWCLPHHSIFLQLLMPFQRPLWNGCKQAVSSDHKMARPYKKLHNCSDSSSKCNRHTNSIQALDWHYHLPSLQPKTHWYLN